MKLNKPSGIEEIFKLKMKYLELLNKCWTIFPRILGDPR